MMNYSDPKRESDPHALPDVETFYYSKAEVREMNKRILECDADSHDLWEPGWYWWACFPGCLPDGDPVGPFETEAEALADAQANSEENGR